MSVARRPDAGAETRPGGGLDARRVVGLILRREFVTRVRTRAFKITTAIMVLAVVGLPVGIHLFGAPSSTRTVGLTPANAAMAAPLVGSARTVGQEVKVRTLPDVPTGERELASGRLDALLDGAPDALTVVANKGLDDKLRQAVTVLAQQQALNAAITRAGGDPAAVASAVAAAKFDVRSLKPAPRYQGERIALGLLAGILVYLSLMIYGQTVAQGVVEEKTSRVVELLLATVRPWQLMLGKVVGIGSVGLGQLVVVAAAGLAAALGTGVLSIPSGVAVGAVGWTLAWYLLGFLLYALLFAAAGALVSLAGGRRRGHRAHPHVDHRAVRRGRQRAAHRSGERARPGAVPDPVLLPHADADANRAGRRPVVGGGAHRGVDRRADRWAGRAVRAGLPQLGDAHRRPGAGARRTSGELRTAAA